MKVSIIIPTRNEEKYIAKCLDSLVKLDYPKNLLEIIICDGLSTDNTRDIIASYEKEYPFIKLVINEKQTTPFSFNLGIRNSTGEFIAIVGARQLLSPDYIGKCISVLDSDTQIGCVGGMVENIYENHISEIIALAMSSPFGVGGGNFRIKNKDGFVDTVGTPVYRKEIFNKFGYFDEELVRNQDDEFNYRLTKNSIKIFFTSQVSLKYYVRASFKNLYRQYYQYGYWKVYVNKKHKTITTVRQMFPFLFICFIFAGAILSFLNRLIFIVYFSVLLLYLLTAFFIGFKKAVKFSDSFKIVYTFLILHFSYGLGYLNGLIRFFIFKKKPVASAMKLSR